MSVRKFGGLFVSDQGEQKVILGTDPAANAECIDTVPAGKAWQLLGVLNTLVTDVNAANRRVTLVVDDGTTTFFRKDAGANQAASLNRFYVWSAGAMGSDQTAFQAEPTTPAVVTGIPDLLLGPGYRIRTVTANKQATDNYGQTILFVVEFAAT